MTSNIHEASLLSSKHEDLDTRIVLHALDALAVGYKRNVGKYHDTDQGIRCIYTVTVSPQGLQYWSLDALRNSESNEMRSCQTCC